MNSPDSQNIKLSDVISEGPSVSNPDLQHPIAKFNQMTGILFDRCRRGWQADIPKNPTKKQVIAALGGDKTLTDFAAEAKVQQPSPEFAEDIDFLVENVVDRVRRKRDEVQQ